MFIFIQFIIYTVCKSTQTENNFSSIVVTNTELAKNIIAETQLMEQKDAKYIVNLQERFLLSLRYQELLSKSAEQQAEIERLQNQIKSMEPVPEPAFVEDLIQLDGK